jgi:hypothetical protein
MSYYLNADHYSLIDVQKRIKETDLIPSRAVLLDGLNEKFQKLANCDITTLAMLREKMKNARQITSLAGETGIDEEYLILLKREIEGWFPKAFSVDEFNWLPEKERRVLKEQGLTNAPKLYEALQDASGRAALSRQLNIEHASLDSLSTWVDLTRIQWVSPLTARLLAAAGCDSALKVASADAEDLCHRVETVNAEQQYFKGKIGLRDIKRLIRAAGYVH